MKKQIYLVIISLFLVSISIRGQQSNDFYTANITGASSIMLNKVDDNSFDYGIDHRFVYGTIYPDESGVIQLNLPRGEYEYIAYRGGMKSKHGTFYIYNRNIYFDVQLSSALFESEDEVPHSSRQLVKDGNSAIDKKEYKKAREMFRLAALDGNADGMYNFAFMLKNGVGGKKKKDVAYYWLKQALEHGHPYAGKRIEEFNQKWRWTIYSVAWGKGGKCIS